MVTLLGSDWNFSLPYLEMLWTQHGIFGMHTDALSLHYCTPTIAKWFSYFVLGKIFWILESELNAVLPKHNRSVVPFTFTEVLCGLFFFPFQISQDFMQTQPYRRGCVAPPTSVSHGSHYENLWFNMLCIDMQKSVLSFILYGEGERPRGLPHIGSPLLLGLTREKSDEDASLPVLGEKAIERIQDAHWMVGNFTRWEPPPHLCQPSLKRLQSCLRS